MLAAQGLLDRPLVVPSLDEVRGVIDQLGVVQIDTINVIERSQYLVLWSRLGAYDATLLDTLLHPKRGVFEYWSHAASIVPMADYPYYRADMAHADELHMWDGIHLWMEQNPETVSRTIEAIRMRGPLASADFERAPTDERTGPWDWYGPKDSRKALDVLWTMGELMVHSRRGGQKIYDLRERVLAEAFAEAALPSDDMLPTVEERLAYFSRRTVSALGVVTPSWLWDYFRLRRYLRLQNANGKSGKNGGARAAAQTMLDTLVEEGIVVPARIEGVDEPAYLAVERIGNLERWRAGADLPTRTTLLSPFDSLIWDRDRARALFDYEVCFEAYVVPEKRRYGYYCLAILHQGQIVGRVDAKAVRSDGVLVARAVYLEPGVVPDDSLLSGLSGALGDLARFLRLDKVQVERSDPRSLAATLRKRIGTKAGLTGGRTRKGG
ncbi:MAG: hypothetical protein OJF49_000117 [Ktedonobacterales bacterium]|jgi:uncharacterized protein YcaQ|nr:MAG: hypothetical protein OJF49_000117 [Ktedonobacterales bacterium]